MRGEEQVQEAAAIWRQLPACQAAGLAKRAHHPPPPSAQPPACRCLCRRDVEERAEQLKAISNLSALIAGFALVSFLQFDFSPSAASEGVQLAFGLTIALTVRPRCPLCPLCDVAAATAQCPMPFMQCAGMWQPACLLR